MPKNGLKTAKIKKNKITFKLVRVKAPLFFISFEKKSLKNHVKVIGITLETYQTSQKLDSNGHS